jgi:hypothetical protein
VIYCSAKYTYTHDLENMWKNLKTSCTATDTLFMWRTATTIVL